MVKTIFYVLTGSTAGYLISAVGLLCLRMTLPQTTLPDGSQTLAIPTISAPVYITITRFLVVILGVVGLILSRKMKPTCEITFWHWVLLSVSVIAGMTAHTLLGKDLWMQIG